MASPKFEIPDFECLGVPDEGAAKEMAIATDISGSIIEGLLSENDSADEYNSSDDMEDSNELSDNFLEFDTYLNTDTSSIEQPINGYTSCDMMTEYAQYNSSLPTDIDLDNQINLIQENSRVPKKDGSSPVFTNLPNLPTDGLFGASLNTEPTVLEAQIASSTVECETFSSANLPNFTEMQSDSTNKSITENIGSYKKNIVYNKDYIPKLEVITDQFDHLFTIGSADKVHPGLDRSRNNMEIARKKRTRRQSKH